MKIKPEDYAILKRAIEGSMSVHSNAEKMYRVQGLSPKSCRWDLLYAAKDTKGNRFTIGDGVGAMGTVNLYAYMVDDHIDTALRRICRENGWEWAATA